MNEKILAFKAFPQNVEVHVVKVILYLASDFQRFQ